MIRRTTRICLRLFVAFNLGLALILGVGAARLSQGPLDLGFLSETLSKSLSAPDGSVLVDIERTVLTWAGWDRTLDIRTRDVTVIGGDGVLARIPEVSITLSVLGLARGEIAPASIEILSPSLEAVRDEAGGIDVGLGGGGEEGRELGDMRFVAEDWLDDPEALGNFRYLKRFNILDADVVIEDRVLGASWHARNLSVRIGRERGGLSGTADLVAVLDDREVQVAGTVGVSRDDGTVEAHLNVRRFEPSWLGLSVGAFAFLREANLPLAGHVDVIGGLDGVLREISFELEGERGSLRIPGYQDRPLDIDGLAVRGRAAGEAAERLLSQSPDIRGLDLEAEVALSLPQDDGPVPVDLSLDHVAGAGRFDMEAALGGVTPSAIAAHLGLVFGDDPAIRDLVEVMRSVHVPIDGSLLISAGLDGTPRTAFVNLQGRAGRIDLPDVFETAIDFQGAELDARMDFESQTLVVNPLRLDLGDGALSLFAESQVRDAERVVEARALFADVPVDDVIRYWPRQVAFKPRAWISQNIEDGVVRDARFDVRLAGPVGDVAALDVREMTSDLLLDGVTVHYLRPMEPARNVIARGRITRSEVRFDLDAGQVRGLQIAEGSAQMFGLEGDDHRLDLRAKLTGPLRDLLLVLDTDPFRLVRKVDLDAAGASGTVDGDLRIQMPLLKDLPMERVGMNVEASLAGGGLQGVALDQDLTDAALKVVGSSDGMRVTGEGRIGGVPVDMDWTEHFDPKRTKAPFHSRIDVTGTVGMEDRTRFGFAFLEPYLRGPTPLSVRMTSPVSGPRTVDLSLGLDQALLALPRLGYEKPLSRPGAASMTVVLGGARRADLTEIRDLTVVAPDLAVNGRIGFDPATSRPLEVELTNATFGRTFLRSAIVDLSREEWMAVILDGGMLDLEPLMSDGASSRGGFEVEPELPFALGIDAKLDLVRLGEGRHFEDARLVALHDGAIWQELDLRARAAPEQWLKVDYRKGRTPDELLVWADDLGAVARVLDVLPTIRKGSLAVAASRAGLDAPMRGRIEIRDYAIVDAPLLANLLSVASLTGIPAMLAAEEGLPFSRLEGQFTLRDDLLRILYMRTFSPSLGITAQGEVDLNRERLSLTGTVAPAYLLSQIIGSIPILGEILTGGEGEGVFAATYAVEGAFEDPEVSVNPLAALAPGVLRRLFQGGPSAEQTAAEPGPSPVDAAPAPQDGPSPVAEGAPPPPPPPSDASQ